MAVGVHLFSLVFLISFVDDSVCSKHAFMHTKAASRHHLLWQSHAHLSLHASGAIWNIATVLLVICALLIFLYWSTCCFIRHLGRPQEPEKASTKEEAEVPQNRQLNDNGISSAEPGMSMRVSRKGTMPTVYESFDNASANEDCPTALESPTVSRFTIYSENRESCMTSGRDSSYGLADEQIQNVLRYQRFVGEDMPRQSVVTARGSEYGLSNVQIQDAINFRQWSLSRGPTEYDIKSTRASIQQLQDAARQTRMSSASHPAARDSEFGLSNEQLQRLIDYHSHCNESSSASGQDSQLGLSQEQFQDAVEYERWSTNQRLSSFAPSSHAQQ